MDDTAVDQIDVLPFCGGDKLLGFAGKNDTRILSADTELRAFSTIRDLARCEWCSSPRDIG